MRDDQFPHHPRLSDGLRRRTVHGATTTDFALLGDSAVRELRGGAAHATYLHGPRGPEYRRDAAGNVRWYLYDGLGSVLGEVDGAGAVTATRKLDVDGAVRATTGTATSNHAFVGGLGHPSEAETGLVYMRARYYDPVLGRFASEDPGRDGSNWFGYAAGNPVCFADADGKRLEPVTRGIVLCSWAAGMSLTVAALEAFNLGSPVLAMGACNMALACFAIALGGIPLPSGANWALAMTAAVGSGLLRDLQNTLKMGARGSNMAWAKPVVGATMTYAVAVTAAIFLTDPDA